MPKERTPISLPDGWNSYVPADSDPYSPVDNDSWETLAERPGPNSLGLNADDLCEFNFGTRIPEEVNWYLHFKVGCTITPDQYNYRFSTADHTPILKLTSDGKPFIGEDGWAVIMDYEKGEGGRSRVYLPKLSAKLPASEYKRGPLDLDLQLRCELCLTQDDLLQLDLFFKGPPPRDNDLLDIWRRGSPEARKNDFLKDNFSKMEKLTTIMGWKIKPDFGGNKKIITLTCPFDEAEILKRIFKSQLMTR